MKRRSFPSMASGPMASRDLRVAATDRLTGFPLLTVYRPWRPVAILIPHREYQSAYLAGSHSWPARERGRTRRQQACRLLRKSGLDRAVCFASRLGSCRLLRKSPLYWQGERALDRAVVLGEVQRSLGRVSKRPAPPPMPPDPHPSPQAGETSGNRPSLHVLHSGPRSTTTMTDRMSTETGGPS